MKAVDCHVRFEGGRVVWTPDAVARVRQVARDGGTARQAAEAVGIDGSRDYLVYKLARKNHIQFRNVGRRRDDSRIVVRVADPVAARALVQRARGLRVPRSELAGRLLTLVLLEGPTFIDNLLDEGA